MKLPVPYEDQALWLKALGKVLFDQNYTLVDGTLCVSLGGPVAAPEHTIQFGAANCLNLFEQARLEFGRLKGLPVTEARDLKLVLKGVWYDMIESGEKPEEYRATTKYWGKRLTNLPDGLMLFSYRNGYEPVPFKHFDTVTFYRGYAKNRPSMTFKVRGLAYDIGNPKWGAEPLEKYFVIKLGARLK